MLATLSLQETRPRRSQARTLSRNTLTLTYSLLLTNFHACFCVHLTRTNIGNIGENQVKIRYKSYLILNRTFPGKSYFRVDLEKGNQS